jgi:hypothetical protein
VNEAAWLQAGAWMNLKWDRHPVDPPVLAAWYVGVSHVRAGRRHGGHGPAGGAVSGAANVAELLAEIKAYRREHGPKLLAEPRPEPSQYHTAWWQLLNKAWGDKRLMPRVMDLGDEHDQWFQQNPGSRAPEATRRRFRHWHDGSTGDHWGLHRQSAG